MIYLLGGIIRLGWFIGVKMLNGGTYREKSPRVDEWKAWPVQL
jgi:hypothetical protein